MFKLNSVPNTLELLHSSLFFIALTEEIYDLADLEQRFVSSCRVKNEISIMERWFALHRCIILAAGAIQLVVIRIGGNNNIGGN